MTTPLSPELSAEIADLTTAQRLKVLEFIQGLKSDAYREERRRALLELAGSISAEDAEIMRRVIEEECERVDPEQW